MQEHFHHEPTPQSLSRCLTADNRSSLSFICPFFEKDPIRNQKCSAHTFRSIRDVKLHIARQHQAPAYCGRCSALFEPPVEMARDAHIFEDRCSPLASGGLLEIAEAVAKPEVKLSQALSTLTFSFKDETPPKPRLAKEEVAIILEQHFNKNPKPTTSDKRALAKQFSVEVPRINNWFQNRRAKDKEKLKKSIQWEEELRDPGITDGSDDPDWYDGEGGDMAEINSSNVFHGQFESNSMVLTKAVFAHPRDSKPNSDPEWPYQSDSVYGLPPSSFAVSTERSSAADSGQESDTESWLDTRKAALIDRTMAWFKQWLGGQLTSAPQYSEHLSESTENVANPTTHNYLVSAIPTGFARQATIATQSNTESGSSGSGSRQHLSQKAKGKLPKRPCRDNGKRGKGNGSERDDDSGDDSDTNNKEQTGNITNCDEKFACPFFKRSPARYRTSRCCVGPGWSSVHRVKEHLYRRHLLPRYVCNRCGVDFKDAPQLSAHQRVDPPCAVQTRDILVEGISEMQERQLKSRKRRGATATTEPDRWKEMYRIIFPDDDEIPSPHYDTAEETAKCQRQVDRVSEYGSFLRRELPPLVRRELELMMEGELEEQLRDRIVGVVQGLHTRLHEAFVKSLPAEDVVQQGQEVQQDEAVDPDGGLAPTATAGPSQPVEPPPPDPLSSPLQETFGFPDLDPVAMGMALDEILQGDTNGFMSAFDNLVTYPTQEFVDPEFMSFNTGVGWQITTNMYTS
ncbi:hypothetical protein B0H63DRAFT_474711 [Podospora didyma]|uniref:Homeobox domain-containing protein n=1 Tax=Podospora didyma TaxID=330526 RepID=A0AAE0NGD3_9PEZI|nr:hypothetical protein B0H63DRAFT_474711 [Podospora didyma]